MFLIYNQLWWIWWSRSYCLDIFSPRSLASYLGSVSAPDPLSPEFAFPGMSGTCPGLWLVLGLIPALWLADSVFTRIPHYRVHLSSHTRRRVPPVPGCTALTTDQWGAREGRRPANESGAPGAEYSTITLRSQEIIDNFLSGMQVF